MAAAADGLSGAPSASSSTATPAPAQTAATGAADPLAGLIDIRGPAPTQPGTMADAALAGAGGIALALLVALALRPFARRPQTPEAIALAQMTAARQRGPSERASALASAFAAWAGSPGAPVRLSAPAGRAALDARFGTDWFAGPAGTRFATALYRPDPELDLDAVERQFAEIIRRGR
ncbi:hypothetical protein [Methyloraptor flagellatus]|uniref:DUF4129 domain-containing protein n=1 Tax=Methyloraptor flagellatus TaxID=3162530 RepID=A0AAU7XB25_9HYPH